MRQVQDIVEVATCGPGLYEVTDRVEAFVDGAAMATGLVTVLCLHTSASLLLQENADPDVQRDLLEFFRRLAPEGMDWVVHDAEGLDDMPAHIKSALTQSSLSIPVRDGRLLLGTWQGLYLFEHRRSPHRRRLALHVVGD